MKRRKQRTGRIKNRKSKIRKLNSFRMARGGIRL